MFKLENDSNLYLAEVNIAFNKTLEYCESIPLIYDTGAAITIIDVSFTDYLGYSISDAIRKSRLDGAGGLSEGYIIKVPKFKCFNFEFIDFEIACHDMDTKLGVTGLLGMNFLEHFKMEINFKHGIISQIQKLD